MYYTEIPLESKQKKRHYENYCNLKKIPYISTLNRVYISKGDELFKRYR